MKRLLLACVASLWPCSTASATDVRLLLQGPATGGVVEVGFHDDFLGAEGCGGTCFAPPVCQVLVPVAATDTPLAVAQAIAGAIRTDPACQAMGFEARVLAHSAGIVLEIANDGIDDYHTCLNFWMVADRFGLCSTVATTPGGTFTSLSATYCSAKANGSGCAARIDTSGEPSTSSPAPFAVTASDVENRTSGLLLYGLQGGAFVPFANGTLCVDPPLRRTPVQASGGSPPPASDCSGGFAFDFNAWAQSGVDPALTSGVAVAAQYWIRDPDHVDGTGVALSNAVEFLVGR